MPRPYFLKLTIENKSNEPLFFKIPNINEKVWKIFDNYLGMLKEEKSWENLYLKVLSSDEFAIFQGKNKVDRSKECSSLNFEETNLGGSEVLLAHLELIHHNFPKDPYDGCATLGVMPDIPPMGGPPSRQLFKTFTRLDDFFYGGFYAGSIVMLTGPAKIGIRGFLDALVIKSLERHRTIYYIIGKDQAEKEHARITEVFIEKGLRYFTKDIKFISLEPSIKDQGEGDEDQGEEIEHHSFDTFSKKLYEINKNLEPNNPPLFVLAGTSYFFKKGDAIAFFRFFQLFSGRCKRMKGLVLCLNDIGQENIDDGSSSNETQFLKHCSNAELEFKLENGKHFFKVDASIDYVTKNWQQFTMDNGMIRLAPRAIDHIR